MKDNCVILVSSCDAYSDCWYPFFTLLKKYWPDCPWKVYLNTESKKYEGDYEVTSLNHPDPDIRWTRRWYNSLDQLDCDYVLTMLDDFFLYDFVQTDKVLQAFENLKNNTDIAYFSFYKNLQNENEPCEFEGFQQVPQKGLYRHTTQIALWRRDVLMKLLDVDANPWQWEQELNETSFDLPYRMITAHSELEKIVFPYSDTYLGMRRGKWRSGLIELFEENEINIDYSIRGVFYPHERVLEESHWQLINADGRLFLMDNGVFSYEKSIVNDNIFKAAELSQNDIPAHFEYNLTDAVKGYLRWDPTDLGGIAIKNLCVRLTDAKGKAKTVPLGDLGSTGIWSEDVLVFPKELPDPQIYIPFSRWHRPVKIEIDCNIECPIDSKTLWATYTAQPDNTKFYSLIKKYRFL